MDKYGLDGVIDTSSLDETEKGVTKINDWADKNNIETQERTDNGIQIAQILDNIETPLEESQQNKSEGIKSFAGNAQSVVDEQMEKQDEITDTINEVTDDLKEKGETEAENINKMQSAVSAFEAGGYDMGILQDYQGKTEDIINQLNDYTEEFNDTNEKLIESNTQACEALSSAIENIKI